MRIKFFSALNCKLQTNRQKNVFAEFLLLNTVLIWDLTSAKRVSDLCALSGSLSCLIIREVGSLVILRWNPAFVHKIITFSFKSGVIILEGVSLLPAEIILSLVISMGSRNFPLLTRCSVGLMTKLGPHYTHTSINRLVQYVCCLVCIASELPEGRGQI